VEPVLVEPADPAAGGDLEVVEAAPVAAVGGQGGGVAVQLGLVERVDGLGHRVIEAVADGADRGSGSELGDAVGVGSGRVLTAGVVVADQALEARSRRAQAAMLSASTTSEACMVRAAFQPTMRRENTSITNAT
jgi:hypothetical protein